MYDGYRSVVVLTDIIVDTKVLICVNVGFYAEERERENLLESFGYNFVLFCVQLWLVDHKNKISPQCEVDQLRYDSVQYYPIPRRSQHSWSIVSMSKGSYMVVRQHHCKFKRKKNWLKNGNKQKFQQHA